METFAHHIALEGGGGVGCLCWLIRVWSYALNGSVYGMDNSGKICNVMQQGSELRVVSWRGDGS